MNEERSIYCLSFILFLFLFFSLSAYCTLHYLTTCISTAPLRSEHTYSKYDEQMSVREDDDVLKQENSTGTEYMSIHVHQLSMMSWEDDNSQMDDTR